MLYDYGMSNYASFIGTSKEVEKADRYAQSLRDGTPAPWVKPRVEDVPSWSVGSGCRNKCCLPQVGDIVRYRTEDEIICIGYVDQALGDVIRVIVKPGTTVVVDIEDADVIGGG